MTPASQATSQPTSQAVVIGNERLRVYLDTVARALAHAGRAAAMRSYCVALLVPGGRKNTELMAALVNPGRVRAKHQSLHHLVAKAGWSDEAVLAAVREHVLPAMKRRAPVSSWIVDSIGLPKQGTFSAGVARQHGEQPDRLQNLQVAVSLSVVNRLASLPVAYRLFLPRAWADDPARRTAAGIPASVAFETRAEIALGQLRRAVAAGIPQGPVLGGIDYGGADFRSALDELGLSYALAVEPATLLNVPANVPGGAEAPGTVPVRTVALGLPARAWRRATWNEAGNRLSSRFAAVRVRPAHAGTPHDAAREAWLLAEWPGTEAAPRSFWLSSLPPDADLPYLVRTVKSRSRGRRGLQELRILGLDHYEGRGWRGFHHHASLCLVAHGFRVAERCSLPAARRFKASDITMPERPQGLRTRRSARAA